MSTRLNTINDKQITAVRGVKRLKRFSYKVSRWSIHNHVMLFLIHKGVDVEQMYVRSQAG